jgi:aerobic carbon-monoxide dehydrogenase medium subunit
MSGDATPLIGRYRGGSGGGRQRGSTPVKASAFEYEQPATRKQAIELLRSGVRSAKVLAGGQSLGPMMNLRLIAPELLVDVTRIPELVRAEDEGAAVVLGACVTHAAIEDGDVVDATRGIMPRIARGIAYRAVRNRGTIGGSLAHADPSADWLSSLAALGATVVIFGTDGHRSVPVAEFMIGVFENALAPDEIVEAVRIPKLSVRARWGFYKACRKPGEFAEAMAAVLLDSERDIQRVVVGATGSTPIILDDVARLLEIPREKVFDNSFGESAAQRLLEQTGLNGDAYERQIRLVVLRRALAQVRAQ